MRDTNPKYRYYSWKIGQPSKLRVPGYNLEFAVYSEASRTLFIDKLEKVIQHAVFSKSNFRGSFSISSTSNRDESYKLSSYKITGVSNNETTIRVFCESDKGPDEWVLVVERH